MPIFKSHRKVQSLGDSLALTLPSLYTKVNEITKGKKMITYFCSYDILIISQSDDNIYLKENLESFLKELESKAKTSII